MKRKWGQSMEPQGTRCLSASPFESEGLEVPKCFPALGNSWKLESPELGPRAS